MIFPYPECRPIYPRYGYYQQGYPNPSQNAVQQTIDMNYMLQARFAAQEQANHIDLDKLMKEYELAIQRDEIRKKLEVAASDEKIMHRSDLKDISDMNTTRIEFISDGGILYAKKGFFNEAELQVPFTLRKVLLFKCLQDNRKILALGYVMGESRAGMYMWTNRLDDRTISRKFNENGLVCGLSGTKEKDFRRCLIKKCMTIAEERCIPNRHGWYFDEGELRFAFPEDLTWMEVSRYAGE